MDLFSLLTQGLRRSVLGRFDSRIWIITSIRLLTSAGFSICLPFLALYLYQERDLPMALVGVIILVGGLCAAVSQTVGGVLSDRLGRRRLLLAALGISVVLYSGLSVLIGFSAPIWAIAITYIAGRSVLMTIQPTVSAMVADLSPEKRLTEAYGLMRVGGNVGWAAGPALGGYLATFVSYGWLFGVAAVATALAFCLVLLLVRETYQGEGDRADFRSVLSVAANRTFVAFVGLSLLVFLGMAHLGSTLSVFTVDRLGFSTAQYGLLLTVNGLIVVLFQYPVARGIDWLGKARSLILGGVLYGLGYLCFGWIVSYGWALGAIAVVTAGEIVFAPTTLSVVSDLSPRGWRGRYMGFYGLSQTMGISLGPLLGGVLLDAFPYDPPFIWGTIAAVSFLAAVGFHRWDAWRRANST
jgi:MFS family permease